MSLQLLQPDWPAPANVRAACTTRAGGMSAAPYDSFNLGDHVGDAPEAVAANRRALHEAIGIRPVYLRQVHGTHTVHLAQATPDGTQADACFTTQHDVACTIMVADCLPVLLTNRQGSVVAAAHAGWRGLAGGVIESTVAGMTALSSIAAREQAGQMMAWLGPCIGPRKFEVGADVKAAFEAIDRAAGTMFRAHAPGKWLADLQGLARLRLHALGITQVFGNDGSDAWCTVTDASRFFSHRRDGVSGRLAACVWLA